MEVSSKEGELEYLAKSGDWDTIKAGLAKGEYHSDDVLLIAAKSGNHEFVKTLLIAHKANPAANNNRAIRLASEGGHKEVVLLLLADPRVDPSAHNNYAIEGAAGRGLKEVVALLLADPRVDPTVDDNLAIQVAAEGGHKEIVSLLLADPRVDPSANNNYAIRWAAERGHKEVVALLLADSRVDPSVVELDNQDKELMHLIEMRKLLPKDYPEIAKKIGKAGVIDIAWHSVSETESQGKLPSEYLFSSAVFKREKGKEFWKGARDRLDVIAKGHVDTVIETKGTVDKARESSPYGALKPGEALSLKELHEILSEKKVTLIGDHPIGRGNFGEVWKAKYKGEIVAVKRPTGTVTERAKNEMRVLKDLSHFGIIEMKDWFEEKIIAVMSFAERGNLYSYLRSLEKPVEWKYRLLWTWQIAEAMEYVHSKGIIHRDLRCANILLDAEMNVKLSDFGICFWRENKGAVEAQEFYQGKDIYKGTSLEETMNPSFDVRLFGIMLAKTLLCGEDLAEIHFMEGGDSTLRYEVESFRKLIELCINPNSSFSFLLLYIRSLINYFPHLGEKDKDIQASEFLLPFSKALQGSSPQTIISLFEEYCKEGTHSNVTSTLEELKAMIQKLPIEERDTIGVLVEKLAKADPQDLRNVWENPSLDSAEYQLILALYKQAQDPQKRAVVLKAIVLFGINSGTATKIFEQQMKEASEESDRVSAALDALNLEFRSETILQTIADTLLSAVNSPIESVRMEAARGVDILAGRGL